MIKICATFLIDKSIYLDYNNINSNLRILSWRSPMIPTMKNYKRTYFVTVQNPLSREVF